MQGHPATQAFSFQIRGLAFLSFRIYKDVFPLDFDLPFYASEEVFSAQRIRANRWGFHRPLLGKGQGFSGI